MPPGTVEVEHRLHGPRSPLEKPGCPHSLWLRISIRTTLRRTFPAVSNGIEPMRVLPRAVLCVAALAPVGCEAIHDPITTFTGSKASTEDELLAEEHREKFLADGDADSIRWLLVHRVKQGMSRDEVAREIGVPGERQRHVPWKDAGGTSFQVTDHVYKWGPDEKGHAYPLVFRNNLLVNYDPRDYQ